MQFLRIATPLLATAVLLGGCARGPGLDPVQSPIDGGVRVATFNIRELSTAMLTQVDAKGAGINAQALSAARVIQAVRPDILAINEMDHDYSTPAAEREPWLNAVRFQDNYLMRGDSPIIYPYIYVRPCNTGILSGRDLDNNGTAATMAEVNTRDYGNDCFGYGNYPGQYSMALYSMFPIDYDAARTFRLFRWIDLPGNHIPAGYYSEEALRVFRLSSKSHWDVPVTVNGSTIHLLLSHPTPQGFDGAEDRNGRRNFDEIRFWRLYLDNAESIYDDTGTRGGLAPEKEFVVLGDLNASPVEGARYDGMFAIQQLLTHPRVVDSTPLQSSFGSLKGRTPGAPMFRERHTFGSGDTRQIDYALPSRGLRVLGGGVYWPAAQHDYWGTVVAEHASDHRMPWIDVTPVSKLPRK